MKKFIIDTNSYSGNFEREMAGYTVGHINEFDTSGDEEMFETFEDYVEEIEDERGSMTVVEICTTPGFGNNGLGYNGDGSPDSYKIAKERYIAYITDNNLKKAEARVEFYKDTHYDPVYEKSEVVRIKKEIEELEARDESTFLPYPAYQSVCIYLKDETPDELIELAKQRAQEFVTNVGSKMGHSNLKDMKIIGFRVEDQIEETSESIEGGDIKVKVHAYKENIIIETIDVDVSDPSFHPNTGSNIGCNLRDLSRLGISEEAYYLLSQIDKCGDAIGDFMWDNNSFGWIGGPMAIKDLKSVGDRTFKLGKYVEIENNPPKEAMDIVDSSGEITEIEYNDIDFEIWIEFRSSKNEDSFVVDFRPMEKRIYDENFKILNSPEGCMNVTDERTKLYIPSDKQKEMKKIIHEDIVKSDDMYPRVEKKDIMSLINRFFDLGFTNNCLDPHDDFWRMSICASIDEIIKTLKKF